MFLIRIFILLIFILLHTCALTKDREEILLNYPKKEINKYQSFLVNPSDYTTNATIFHKKYSNHLIGIARTIVEEKGLSIIKESIGFYYDKKENTKTKLFLGVEISISLDPSLSLSSYNDIALSQLKKYLKDLLYIVNSCKSIFSEKEIVGMVIGIHWEGNSRPEMINIWIVKTDVIRYEGKHLTTNELIERNPITNTDGKIINLSI